MITSSSNPRVKNLIQLQKKHKFRKEQQSFVVEGLKMLLEAPDERVREIYMSESFSKIEDQRKAVFDKAKKAQVQVEILSDKVFKEVSDTMTPQGVLAVIRLIEVHLDELLKTDGDRPKLLMILESLQDPGNFGTILRSGEGAGIDGIIVNKTTVDPYMPKVIRSTMGSIYRVPVVVEPDLTEVVRQLKALDVKVYAAHLKGKRAYYQADFTTSTCFMIGNEAAGLTDTLAEAATDYILIPMSGKVESLNAGIASALLMYEAKRQRNIY